MAVSGAITAPAPYNTTSDKFGHSVAASANGSVAVVGSPGATSGQGAAFVYQAVTPSGLSLMSALEASDAVSGSGFGTSVSVSASGQGVAVGAPYRTENGRSSSGAVYVYSHSSSQAGTWIQHSKLTSTYSQASYRLGWSVAIDDSLGDVILMVGCNYHYAGSGGFTEYYQYNVDTSTWDLKYRYDMGSHGALLGYSVALSGSHSAIGSPSDNFDWKSDQGTLFYLSRRSDTDAWSNKHWKTGGGR